MPGFDLDTILLSLNGKDGSSAWTIRHAVEGVQIFGGIGSGKTSGSGRLLALKFLKAGFGGLVLTAKPDERNLWEDYCRLTGRTNDLVIVGPDHPHGFNFLDYETGQGQNSTAITENIVDLLKTVIKAGEEKSHGKNDDAFWENALDMLLFNLIDLCRLAYGSLSVQEMFDIVQSIPKTGENGASESKKEESPKAYDRAIDAAVERLREKLQEWEHGLSNEILKEIIDEKSYRDLAMKEIPEYRQLHYVQQFFEDNFIPLSEKTRSIVEFSFSGFLFRLLRDPVYSLFCSKPSTFVPEDCANGKIVLLDLPVKLYDKAGRDTQIMFKYIWQRAMERRDVRVNPRPVFLWADEAQHFLHQHDADTQATARSSRICTVYISQNLPNYFANMGGQKAEFRVKSFLGTLGTKIFHANADTGTNQYASELIGDARYEKITEGNTVGLSNLSKSQNRSVEVERIIRPEQFIRLKTGSPRNDYHVEGILHRQGDPFASGENHIKMRFNQNYNP